MFECRPLLTLRLPAFFDLRLLVPMEINNLQTPIRVARNACRYFLLLSIHEAPLPPKIIAHRKNDIRVFAALEEIAKNIIRDAPKEGHNPIVYRLVHIRAYGAWRLVLTLCSPLIAGHLGLQALAICLLVSVKRCAVRIKLRTHIYH